MFGSTWNSSTLKIGENIKGIIRNSKLWILVQFQHVYLSNWNNGYLKILTWYLPHISTSHKDKTTIYLRCRKYINYVWILYEYGKKIFVIGFDPGGFIIEFMDSCGDGILIGEWKLENTKNKTYFFSMTMYYSYQHVIL